MLAQARKFRRKIFAVLFCTVAITFASCASQHDSVRLVDDPDDRHDSALPWSRQEKWEVAPDANALGPTASSDQRR
jgi:hypothetical protein